MTKIIITIKSMRDMSYSHHEPLKRIEIKEVKNGIVEEVFNFPHWQQMIITPIKDYLPVLWGEIELPNCASRQGVHAHSCLVDIRKE